MKKVIAMLEENPQVSDYKINVTKTESFELFFVKGRLETARCTDTCDRQVTVYADHGEFRGDSQFFLYPSTTDAEVREKIQGAVRNALLICNRAYTLPEQETGEYRVASNFEDRPMNELAAEIADLVFRANTHADGSLNSVEVFVNRHTKTVQNSRGLCKTQHTYDAMVEAIPTFNGSKESVELYEQYSFSSLDPDALTAEIARKMDEVAARYHAEKPELPLSCPVVFNQLELSDLFWSFAQDLNYATVYGHSNLYHKGDRIQKNLIGDPITVRLHGTMEGDASSACFDADGLSLGDITLIDRGTAENYYGANRFGQYLGEEPTGNLPCLEVLPGTLEEADLQKAPYLEIVSMSGLQLGFFNNYIGGEVRLAYYHDGTTVHPVTGISVSGKLQEALDRIRLSRETAHRSGYLGPAKAVLDCLTIF